MMLYLLLMPSSAWLREAVSFVITSLVVVDHSTISCLVIVGTMSDNVTFQSRPTASCQSPARFKTLLTSTYPFILFLLLSQKKLMSFSKVSFTLHLHSVG
jgi:hypothetical protein